jgi:hypothetical protein
VAFEAAREQRCADVDLILATVPGTVAVATVRMADTVRFLSRSTIHLFPCIFRQENGPFSQHVF